MFRVIKALNNNGVLAIRMDNQAEVIVLGKGIGFGKKVNERFELVGEAKVYELKNSHDGGKAYTQVMQIEPIYLEITGSILQKAQEELGEIDTRVILPLADHIAFAVNRIQSQGYISNPMTQDIRGLFSNEFQVALYGLKLIEQELNIKMDEDEAGYIALHLHGALVNERVSNVLVQTQIIHDALDLMQQRTGVTFDVTSLSYNRLLSHMKYMIARMMKKEAIGLDMNSYIKHQYPKTYLLAEEICKRIATILSLECMPEEIGYLAMHIERVCLKNTKI